MMKLTISVRCTREEYMDFCVNRRARLPVVTAAGALIIASGVATALIGGMNQGCLLMWLVGATAMMFSPLIFPMMLKGEAARRYDASDSLKLAFVAELTEEAIAFKSSTVEGRFPKEAVTNIVETDSMAAIEFAREVQICIPKRALSDEERAMLEALLQCYKKD
ncbi:MAG: YcxB family protein [Clostridia bacterium]|nr:YcxB family protein [Clostridia bacterium]